jgi:hypothetical protein
MEELMELRSYIEQGRYGEALILLGEMEEMSRDDKINKIGSFIDVLLIHMIKQIAEKRTTPSWDFSIRNALRNIAKVNKRRKAGGYYMLPDELAAVIAESYPYALEQAALEAFGGVYSPEQLDEMVDAEAIQARALELVTQAQQAG